VLSARYAGEPKSDARNNAKLIAALVAGRRPRRHRTKSENGPLPKSALARD